MALSTSRNNCVPAARPSAALGPLIPKPREPLLEKEEISGHRVDSTILLVGFCPFLSNTSHFFAIPLLGCFWGLLLSCRLQPLRISTGSNAPSAVKSGGF